MALDALEQAPRFNRWMYETIQPALGDRVAELGSGRGKHQQASERPEASSLTDYRVDYLEDLSRLLGKSAPCPVAPLDCWIQAITRP